MSEEKQNQSAQIQIKAADADLKGAYSNMMQIAHTQEEFILDFLNITPPLGILSSRIITSPAHLKRIITALTENLKIYEEHFGTVSATEEIAQKIGFKLN